MKNLVMVAGWIMDASRMRTFPNVQYWHKFSALLTFNGFSHIWESDTPNVRTLMGVFRGLRKLENSNYAALSLFSFYIPIGTSAEEYCPYSPIRR